MDALARADEVLARARGRAHVVTPEDATSPMDAASTVQIPSQLIAAVDPQQDTIVISPGPLVAPRPRAPEPPVGETITPPQPWRPLRLR